MLAMKPSGWIPILSCRYALFGCDYMYERGYIYFDNGTVRAGGKDMVASGIQQRIDELDGKKVPPEWAQGLPSYFRRPD